MTASIREIGAVEESGDGDMQRLEEAPRRGLASEQGQVDVGPHQGIGALGPVGPAQGRRDASEEG